MIPVDRYQFAIEEMALSGEIGLGSCSRSTLYRWLKEINDRLARQRASWRAVINDVPSRCLRAVDLEETAGPEGK